MHRWKRAGGYGNGSAPLVDLVEHRKRGPTVLVDGPPLSIAQGAADAPLTHWPSCPSREDVVTRLREPRDELVRRQDPRELTRNRGGARRAVGLGGSPLTLPIYLPREFDLGVIKVGETNVRPRQPK